MTILVIQVLLASGRSNECPCPDTRGYRPISQLARLLPRQPTRLLACAAPWGPPSPASLPTCTWGLHLPALASRVCSQHVQHLILLAKLKKTLATYV
jgi:hypothetical protein